eukprot:3496326-Rhodomonas_salina.3
MSGTDMAYAAMPCPVLTWRMLLCHVRYCPSECCYRAMRCPLCCYAFAMRCPVLRPLCCYRRGPSGWVYARYGPERYRIVQLIWYRSGQIR